jgi:predicted restriction endonuclease
MWKGEGEKQFKEQDAEGRELNVPLEGLDVFDPLDADDGRTKTERLIALRQGQPAFRNALIDAYEGRCAITGCEVREVLEAAHISPYRGTHTNHVTNGLLLRADIHTLFDRGLIRVDRNYRVSASPEVAAAYDLPATLTLPVSPAHQPSPDAFDQKWR